MGTETRRPVAATNPDRSPGRTSARLLHVGWGTSALTWSAVFLAVASAAVTVWGGWLSGPEAMQGSARGTAWVMLALAAPAVAFSTAFGHDSPRWLLVRAGGMAFLVYNSLALLLLTPYNRAFLVYVALLSTSFWGLVALIRGLDARALSERAEEGLHRRALAIYVLAVVSFNALAWLAAVANSLRESDPLVALEGTGVMTNALWIQDLAIWLPIAAAGAVWLWRRQAWGVPIVGGMLVFWVIESISVAVDQWFGASADPQSDVVSMSVVPVFGVLAAVNAWVAWLLLRRLRARPGRP